MSHSRRSAVVWGALFGYLVLLMFVVGLESAWHFLGPAIDGPFQLYNALRRITVGQRPGVGFEFFHGVLIPYLHYPLFRLLGGGFIASEITRELVSIVLYPLTIVVFLKFFLKDWTRTLAWSAMIMATSIALRMTSVLVAINSLLGVRSTLPVLFPVVLCLPVRRAVRNALAALMLGGALLLGTEQGLALILAIAVTTVVLALRSPRRGEWIADAAITLAGGALVTVVVLTMLGGVDGMATALRYNFKLVPRDQYWYFGAPPNIFLSSWGAIPGVFASLKRIPMVIGIGVVAMVLALRRLWTTSPDRDERRDAAMGILLVYGVVSCASLLGTWANAYIQPLLRSLLLVGALFLADYLPRYDAQKGRALVAGVGRSTVGLAVASLLIMVSIVTSVYATTFVSIPHVVRDHVIGRKGAVYSGIWPNTIVAGQAMLDSRRAADGTPPTLWSTYAGLLEARNGLFHPSFDYIIHALGPENRERYVRDFVAAKPLLVQTVNPKYTQYEAWIESTSWDFYTELLRNYDVVGGTEWSLFWQRRPSPSPAPQLIWSTTVRDGMNGVMLPALHGDDPYSLIQVELDYATHNPLLALPVVGAMPRYLVITRNAVQREPVTLDPYVRQGRFPLIITNDAPAQLQWRTFGLLPGASISVSAVRVYRVPTSARNRAWFDALLEQQLHGSSQ